jgi:hypothetical protein
VILANNFGERLEKEWNVDLNTIKMITGARDRSNNTFFKEAMISGCWSIWNQRNGIIFDGGQRDLDQCFSHLKSSFCSIRHRAKLSLKEGMQDWLDTL